MARAFQNPPIWYVYVQPWAWPPASLHQRRGAFAPQNLAWSEVTGPIAQVRLLSPSRWTVTRMCIGVTRVRGALAAGGQARPDKETGGGHQSPGSVGCLPAWQLFPGCGGGGGRGRDPAERTFRVGPEGQAGAGVLGGRPGGGFPAECTWQTCARKEAGVSGTKVPRLTQSPGPWRVSQEILQSFSPYSSKEQQPSVAEF